MNKFVRKLLAKYVKYIEIIGYGLVVIFIAGLVALSTIKAEDEFVQLTGSYEIASSLIRSSEKLFVMELLTDTHRIVLSGDDLLKITEDQQYISDQSIRMNLEAQVAEARKVEDTRMVRRLSSIITELDAKTYPGLVTRSIEAAISGEFILFHGKEVLVEDNTPLGGIFDFENSLIRVTEMPTDKRMKKKLKADQTATVTLDLGGEDSCSFNAILTEHGDEEIILSIKAFSAELKRKIATHISQNVDIGSVDCSISVLVGTRTWMNLIWR